MIEIVDNNISYAIYRSARQTKCTYRKKNVFKNLKSSWKTEENF